MEKIVTSLLLCLLILHVTAGMPQDSVRRKNHSWLITSRINTMNMAPVSGNIINRNVNADVTVAFTKQNLLLTLQNGADLQDFHSEMNYFLVNARFKLRITKSLSLVPFLAFYSEHAHKLFDTGSDANGGMFFIWQNRTLSIEAFALVVKLTTENQNLKDVVNRLEVKWNLRSIIFSGFIYHNARYFDEDEKVSIGFRAMLPEVLIFEKVRARTDVTGSFKVYEKPKTLSLSGVFLSLCFPVSLSD